MTPAQRQDAAVWLAARCLGWDAGRVLAELQAARRELVVMHLTPPADWRPVREQAEAELAEMVG